MIFSINKLAQGIRDFISPDNGFSFYIQGLNDRKKHDDLKKEMERELAKIKKDAIKNLHQTKPDGGKFHK